MAYFIQGEKHPLIFLANFRTGSTSTAKAIMDNGGRQIVSHHAPIDPDDVPENALVAHTVRHHCDVLVSYWYKKASGQPFDEFVKLVLDGYHPYLRADGFYNHWPVTPNYVLRFETLDFEWQTLCLNAGLPDIKLVQSNSKRPKGIHWKLLFTPDLYGRVAKQYAEEMEKYGYGRS